MPSLQAPAAICCAASLIDQGEEARVEAYHCKYYCAEMAFAIDTCMQIHGVIARHVVKAYG